jgi:hypothetical protein
MAYLDAIVNLKGPWKQYGSSAGGGWPGSSGKTIVPWIRAIYLTEAEELAHFRLDAFEAEWGRRYRRSAKPGGGTGTMHRF